MNPAKSTRLIIWVAVVLYISFPGAPQSGWVAEDDGFGRYIDTHMHFDSERTPWNKGATGRGEQGKSRQGVDSCEASASFLVEQMDRFGVARSLIMPPPAGTVEQGRILSYKKLLSSIRKYPERLFLAAGGDSLNPMIQTIDRERVTPGIKEEFRKKACSIIDDGAVAFGETAVLHISMQDRHGFQQVDADHPLYLLLSDISAERNIPIDIHMEAVPEDMDTPAYLLRASRNNPKRLKATMPGFERLLSHNRKAKIVWQHIGWDNTGYMTVKLLREILERHPNVYLSLRIEKRTIQVGNGGPMPNRIVDGGWKIKPEWLSLIKSFPDRFMIGSDEFMGVSENSRSPQSFEETWPVLKQLPPELAKKIGHDNPAMVYNMKD